MGETRVHRTLPLLPRMLIHSVPALTEIKVVKLVQAETGLATGKAGIEKAKPKNTGQSNGISHHRVLPWVFFSAQDGFKFLAILSSLTLKYWDYSPLPPNDFTLKTAL